MDAALVAVLRLPFITRSLISACIQFYCFLILAWTLLSYFDHSRGFMSDLFNVLDAIVRPFVSIFKKLIPPTGALDFSPMVAIIVLQLINRLFSYL